MKLKIIIPGIVLLLLVILFGGFFTYKYVFYDYQRDIIEEIDEYFLEKDKESLDEIKSIVKMYEGNEKYIDNIILSSLEKIEFHIDGFVSRVYYSLDELEKDYYNISNDLEVIYESIRVNDNSLISADKYNEYVKLLDDRRLDKTNFINGYIAFKAKDYDTAEDFLKKVNESAKEYTLANNYLIQMGLLSNDDATKNMNQVSVSDVISLFASKTNEVIYIGSPNCGACKAFLPVLNEVQDSMGFKTNYLNINDVVDDEELQKMLSLMTKKTTVIIDEKEVEKTFAEFFWYTPTIMVVRNGKIVDGFIGADTKENYIKFLESVGIKKS